MSDSSDAKQARLWTLCARAGHDHPPPPSDMRPHVTPIYQTASFDYQDSDAADRAIAEERYLYTRYANPTDDALGSTLASLEGAEAALTFSSGMGAIAAALETLCGSGSHLVSVEGLYGGSHELITGILPRFGVEYSLVAAATRSAIAPALKRNTTCVYVESVSNPLLRVADLDDLAGMCRKQGIPLVVDATFATPLNQRPIERGAALSVHSGTKYLSGHGDVTFGVVSGALELIQRIRHLRKYHGASTDPFAAWLVLRGLKTLPVRFRQAERSAALIASALEGMPGVERVHYPGLPSHPDHGLATRLLDGAGAMVSFEVAGGLAPARRVYDRLKRVARAASLGDVSSLMTHPARFSHVHVDPEVRTRAGITDGLLRLSVGLEDASDLIQDLRQALI